MELSHEDAKAITGFIARYLRLWNDDAPLEEFDKWRADVRSRFPERSEEVLLKVHEVLKKFR